MNRLLAFLIALTTLCPAADLPDGLCTEINTARGVVVCEVFFEKTPLTATSYVYPRLFLRLPGRRFS